MAITDVYFGTVYQIDTPEDVPPITNFRLPNGEKPTNAFFTGIPLVVAFGANRNGKIGLYETDPEDEIQYFVQNTTLTRAGFQIYTNFLPDTDRKYFSTINDGNVLDPGENNPFPIPDIPAVLAPVPASSRYYTYRYFTQLNQDDVNLNNSTAVTLGWSSSDISGSYGNDISTVRIYKFLYEMYNPFNLTFTKFGTLIAGPFDITNNTTIPTDLFSTIPSDIYYYTYDFVTKRIDAIVEEGYSINYTYGSNAEETTGIFSFITQFLQSITAGNIAPGGTTTIVPNFGVGYPLNSYQITVNDSTNSTRRSRLPYNYTPPITTNTRTYTITVNASSDTNDTNTRTVDFIAYQYVTNLAISTRIIQSARNFITWTRGSTTEQFQYGTTAIRTNGSLNFVSGNKVDTTGLVAGIGYQIIPTNVFEKNPASGAYPTVYFDSIAPNQEVLIDANRNFQTYKLRWNAYYTSILPAPDGTRQYLVTFTGNGTTYTGTSTYNEVTIPYSAVAFGVPYSIQVEDIIVATNIFFFDTPTNFAITPNKINYNNTVTWVAPGNPVFNVRMGNYVFQSSSPYTYNLTEDIIDPSGNVSFWPLGSTESSAIFTNSYFLNENTILIILPSPLFFFSGVFFSTDDGDYLYPSDTYSLSLYRNNAVVQQLEASITIPFTFIPYEYVADYQPGDQFYLKSNQHLNYGISAPFTFVINASVTVDQSEYTLFSTIVATMTVDADVAFTAQLRGPVTIPVAFTQQGDQYTIQLKDYNITIGNYQLDFALVNSPSIIISSPTFLVTTAVTVDQPNYTIISTVNATLYVGLPTTFTVRLQDVDQLFPAIVLPSFTANLLSTYSFRLYGLPVNDANYVLRFTAGTVLTSPVFAVSTTYFSLEKPVVPTPPSRATSNTLCVTTKKNNIPTTIISIMNNIVYPKAIRGQPQFLVPCGILPYLKELTELLKTLSLRDALLFLIQKYNIPQNTPAVTNQKRYQLPTANSKVLNPILQYTSSFRLSSKVTGNSVPISTAFVQKLSDARILTLCNDDTKTFSSSYTDMLKNATYWISTLAPFTKDGDYTFCVVRPLQGSLKQFITASITLKDNQLIFTPVILRVVLSFYEPYGAVDFSVMFTSPLLSEILKYLTAQYEKIYINPATAL